MWKITKVVHIKLTILLNRMSIHTKTTRSKQMSRVLYCKPLYRDIENAQEQYTIFIKLPPSTKSQKVQQMLFEELRGWNQIFSQQRALRNLRFPLRLETCEAEKYIYCVTKTTHSPETTPWEPQSVWPAKVPLYTESTAFFQCTII